jgi:RNA polymerase sigma factor (TIGR02999 family)
MIHWLLSIEVNPNPRGNPRVRPSPDLLTAMSGPAMPEAAPDPLPLPLPEPGAVTRLLAAAAEGEPSAARKLLPLVYDEMRRLAAARLAREAPGQTLQATALVHEAYLRLVGLEPDKHWDGRAHFFAAAAEAMRRILIDRARDRRRLKRGGGRRRQDLDLEALTGTEADPDDLLDLDAALASLDRLDPRAATLVKLRVFAGLTLDEAAVALGVVRRTADRDWAFARAWLFNTLAPRTPS